MTAVKAGDVERAVRRRSDDVQLLLIYGPDAGRVAELSRQAATTFVADPSDAFQLIRMDGDRVAEQPGCLVEEASTFGLFSGRRSIWVRSTSRNIAPAVSACLEASLSETLVVIEAGDLAKGSALRQVCEASPRALALPCYPDEARDLAALLSDTARAGGVTIHADASQLLVDALGGDRLASRSELAKLMLYVHPSETITVADVEAVVSDVSALSYDGVIDAAFGGDAIDLELHLAPMAHQPGAMSALLPLAIRHGLALLATRGAVDSGQSTDEAVRNWRGLHFRRKGAVARQLSTWTASRLHRALAELQAASLETRRTSALAAPVCSHAFQRIAQSAKAAAARQGEVRSLRQSPSS